jgi:hypothetical protein
MPLASPLVMTPTSEQARDIAVISSIAPVSGADRNEAQGSGVSWPAIFAGGLATSATCLILLALGAGFELSSVSPLSTRPTGLRHLGWPTIAWILFSQLAGAAFGGYLAGRLRTKWARIHSDEVYFRDTAHGFLAWALATVMSAAFLASAGSLLATGAVAANSAASPVAVHADRLLRSDRAAGLAAGQVDTADRLATERILDEVLATGTFPSDDETYLTAVVSRTSGLSAADAHRRVTDVVQRAQQDAEAQRRIAARLLLWTFVALLCGAFTSSVAATIGGKQRDGVMFA